MLAKAWARFKRRDDAFELRAELEGGQGFGVGRSRDWSRGRRVQAGVLRADAG